MHRHSMCLRRASRLGSRPPWRRCGYALISIFSIAAASAHAGLFQLPRLKDADAAQIHHLAIASMTGNEIHGQLLGTTVFQNKEFRVQPEGWDLDARLVQLARDQVLASVRLPKDARIEPIDLRPVKDYTRQGLIAGFDSKKIIARAREGGFDAVLTIIPALDPSMTEPVAGTHILRRKALGLIDRLSVCVGLAADLYRVSDGKELGYQAVGVCSYGGEGLVWHDRWEDYNPAEQQAAMAAVGRDAEHMAKGALEWIGFKAASATAGPPQGEPPAPGPEPPGPTEVLPGMKMTLEPVKPDAKP